MRRSRPNKKWIAIFLPPAQKLHLLCLMLSRGVYRIWGLMLKEIEKDTGLDHLETQNQFWGHLCQQHLIPNILCGFTI